MDVKNIIGFSALHIASLNGLADNVGVLLDAGEHCKDTHSEIINQHNKFPPIIFLSVPHHFYRFHIHPQFTTICCELQSNSSFFVPVYLLRSNGFTLTSILIADICNNLKNQTIGAVT